MEPVIDMISTVLERPGVCNNVPQNLLHYSFGSIRILAKTVQGVIYPAPVAGIRVNSLCISTHVDVVCGTYKRVADVIAPRP